jgi:hypothetical protein
LLLLCSSRIKKDQNTTQSFDPYNYKGGISIDENPCIKRHPLRSDKEKREKNKKKRNNQTRLEYIRRHINSSFSYIDCPNIQRNPLKKPKP